MPQRRDDRGRYMNDDYDRYYDDRRYDRDGRRNGSWEVSGRYSNYPYVDERTRRYVDRMMEGVDTYNEGRDRYRHGDNEDKMIDGIEMAMAAVCMFVESLSEFAETPKEKEIIRKHLEKMKKI